MPPIEKREPTHVLTVSVPLHLDLSPNATAMQEALAEALRTVLPLISLGTLGLLCGSPEVILVEADCLTARSCRRWPQKPERRGGNPTGPRSTSGSRWVGRYSTPAKSCK